MLNEKGYLRPIKPGYIKERSQDIEEAYHDAGQFYFAKTELWLNKKNILENENIPLIISRLRSQDIDDIEDWILAEKLFEISDINLKSDMNIAFRVDSSEAIGTGHCMRCLTLALKLKETGLKVIFVCRKTNGNLINLIERHNFKVIPLNSIANHEASNFSNQNIDLDATESLEIFKKVFNQSCHIGPLFSFI